VSCHNFLKSLPFQLVEFDAFQYLAFSKALWAGSVSSLPPIRSPLTALFIVPNLLAARFTMVLCHIGIAALVYLLGRRLVGHGLPAAFAALAYGLSRWMLVFQTSPLTDLPGMLLFLAGLAVWLGADRRHVLWSGVIFGAACLMRFDILLLVIPVALLTRRGLKRYLLLPLAGFLGPVELAFDALAYQRLVWVPWEFARANLDTFGSSREAFFRANLQTLGRFAARDVLAVGKTLWHTFPSLVLLSLCGLLNLKQFGTRLLLMLLVPWLVVVSVVQPFEPRIVVVKAVPLLALLAATVFVMLNRVPVSTWARRMLAGVIVAAVVIPDVAGLSRLAYQPRRFKAQDCVAGRVCSNFAPAVEYFCGVRTTLFTPTGETVEQMRDACDFFVYFKDISGYTDIVNASLRKTATLHGDNTAASVYQFR